MASRTAWARVGVMCGASLMDSETKQRVPEADSGKAISPSPSPRAVRANRKRRASFQALAIWVMYFPL